MTDIQQAEPLDQAILALLGKLPLRWKTLDSDALTATEQEALKLLTAGGLVERRFSFRLNLIGHPVTIEATITATGEYGLVEALGPVAKIGWEVWAAEYLKRRARAEQDRPRLHCENTGPQHARLTDQGELALKDVKAGNAKVVLDFVHRRTAVFYGKTVPGHGRAEKVRTEAPAPGPAKVKVTNLPEVSKPLTDLADTMTKLFEVFARANPPQANKEQPWVNDAPEYLPLSEARKLTDNRLSLPTLSKLLTPNGEIRYMRKRGVGCKLHVADFRKYIRSRISDPEFAKAYAEFREAVGKGDRRWFWSCESCGHEYPENADASDRCPKCNGKVDFTSKTAPKPRR